MYKVNFNRKEEHLNKQWIKWLFYSRKEAEFCYSPCCRKSIYQLIFCGALAMNSNTQKIYSLTTYIPSIVFPSASSISHVPLHVDAIIQFTCTGTYGIFDTWSVLFGGKIFWKFLDPGFLNRCKGECVKSFVRLFS